jgi:hypothetical protein
LTKHSNEGFLIAERMARRSITGVKLKTLEARTRVINGLVGTSSIFCAMALGFVVVASAVPQHRELAMLEKKLKLAKAQEATITADLEYRQIEYRALREDPAFLEIHARDRLDYCRDGERVLKFKTTK